MDREAREQAGAGEPARAAARPLAMPARDRQRGAQQNDRAQRLAQEGARIRPGRGCERVDQRERDRGSQAGPEHARPDPEQQRGEGRDQAIGQADDDPQPIGLRPAGMKREEIGSDRVAPMRLDMIEARATERVHRQRDDREPMAKEAVALAVAALRPTEGSGRLRRLLTRAMRDPGDRQRASLGQALRGLKDDLVVGIGDPTASGAGMERGARDEEREPSPASTRHANQHRRARIVRLPPA